MPRLKSNIIANFIGKGWAGIMALAFTPFYVKALGVESYGLIGIYAAIQAVLSVLEFGLSTALSRELARYYAVPEKAGYLRDLARTIGVFYWAVALVIGITGTLLSSWLAEHWIGSRSLTNEVMLFTLNLMAWGLAFQWPFTLYSAGMNGLQKQLQLNRLVALWATLRWAGGAAVVLWVSPTIQAFFVWQLATSLLQSATTAKMFWGQMPGAPTPARFDAAILKGIGQFASGVAGASILGVVLTQLDKIMLSKLLPLEQFAYYSMAATLATALYFAVSPVITAVFPRLSELAARSDSADLYRTFHKSAQLIAALIFPLAWLLILYAEDIVFIWMRDAEIARHTSLLVSLIAAGTLLNALIHAPHALLLANGISRFWFYVNLVSVLVLVPAILFLTQRYGSVGAPVAWIALNLGYLFIAVPLMPFPRSQKLHWAWRSVALPIAAVGMASGAVKWLQPEHSHGLAALAWIVLSLAAGLLTVFALFRRDHIPSLRRLLFRG